MESIDCVNGLLECVIIDTEYFPVMKAITHAKRYQKDVKQFDVALSFAGEDRKYVEKVADMLRRMDIKVFYDKYEAETLWGKNLYYHLADV